jgi:hypothetical protein
MKIHPVKHNGFYLTPLHEDKRDIICIKDSISTFFKNEAYKYIKCEHHETGIEVWMVYSKSGDQHFYTRNRLDDIFDTKQILREEKINKIIGD